MRPSALIWLWLLLFPLLLRGGAPSPTPDPRLSMAQEITGLRTARALAEASQKPPTAAEIATFQRAYDDLIARFPQEAEPHAALGEFLLAQGKNKAALAEWQTALQLDPQRPDLLAAQADLLLQDGQIVAAADALEKAIALAPHDASYQFGVAHLYTLFRRDLMATRRLSENELITRGTEYFHQAALLAPENLTYAQAYAEAFYTQPDPDWRLARAAWESLLARSSEKDFIHTHLVRVNIRLHDKAAARLHLAAVGSPAFASLRLKLQKQIDQL